MPLHRDYTHVQGRHDVVCEQQRAESDSEDTIASLMTVLPAVGNKTESK